MPAFPHLTDVEMDELLVYPAHAVAWGRAVARRFRRRCIRRDRWSAPAERCTRADHRPRAGFPAARWRRRIPRASTDTPQYTINEYGTIGKRMKPPYTTITKYDLNIPAIVWQVGFGDDPELAEKGMTGTGMPQMRNGAVVTDTGLYFAAGGDNKIRAYDTANGTVLWTGHYSGTYRGAPIMYAIDGRQYLLVPAAGDRLPAGNQVPPYGKPPGRSATSPSRCRSRDEEGSMAALSRRHFIGSTAGSALAAAVLPARGWARPRAAQPAGRLRVQFAPGGHTSPLQMYAMFESALFQDMDTVVLPHPDAFDRVGTPDAPHVIVTNDWITGQWPEKEQQNMQRHVEGGGGVVVLHHAVGSNNGTTTGPGWKWWSEDVMGCYLYNPNVPGVKTSARLKQFPDSDHLARRQPPDRQRHRAVPAAVGRDVPQHVDLAEGDRAVHLRRSVVQQSRGRLDRATAAARPLRVPPTRTHRDRLPGSDLPADRPQRHSVGRREAVMTQVAVASRPTEPDTAVRQDRVVGAAHDRRQAVPAVVPGDVPRSHVHRHGDLGHRSTGEFQLRCCRRRRPPRAVAPARHRRRRRRPAPAAPVPPGAPGPGAGALGGGTERLEPADYPWEPSGGRPHPGYDVLVLNDQTNWPETQRTAARQAIEAGRGLVVLHHALGDNQDWPWWYEEVTGGQLVLADRTGVRRSTVSRVASLAAAAGGPASDPAPRRAVHRDQRGRLQGHVAVAEDHALAADIQPRQRHHRGLGRRASDGAGGVHPARGVTRDASAPGLPDAGAQRHPLGRATPDLSPAGSSRWRLSLPRRGRGRPAPRRDPRARRHHQRPLRRPRPEVTRSTRQGATEVDTQEIYTPGPAGQD